MTCRDFELAMVIKAQDEASQALGRIGESIKAIGLALAAFATAAIGAAAAAGNAFAEFQQGLLNVQAASEGTREDYEKFKKAALEASEATKFNPKETVQALYDLSSAGLKAADAIKTLNPVLQLASASNASLGRTAENVIMVMGQFNLGAEKAQGIADTMTAAISASTMNAERITVAFRNAGATANAMGQSFEGTTALLSLLTNSFVSGEAAGTGLKSLLNEMNQKSKEFGIEMRDAAGKTKPLVDILDGMKRAGWDADRAVTKFGSDAGPTLAILLNAGTDALREMEEKVQANGQAAKAAAIQNSGLKAALTSLASTFDVLSIKMGEAVEPGEKLMAKQLEWFLKLPGVVSAAQSLGAAVGSMGQYVVPILLDIANAGIWMANQFIYIANTPAFQWLRAQFHWIGLVAEDVFKRVNAETARFGGFFNTVSAVIRVAANAIVGGALNIIDAAMKASGTSWKDVSNGIVAAFKWVMGTAWQLADGTYRAMVEFGAALNANGITTQSVGRVIAAAFKWIFQGAQEVWKGGGEAFSGLGNTMRENGVTIRSVVSGIVTAFNWIKEAITGLEPQFKAWAAAAAPHIQSIRNEINWFGYTLEAKGITTRSVIDNIVAFFGRLKGAVLEMMPHVQAWGLALSQAFDEVRRIAGVLWDGVGSAFGKIVAELKKMGIISGDVSGNVKKGLLEMFSGMEGSALDKLKAFTEHLKEMKPTSGDVSKWIVDKFNEIVAGIKDFYNKAKAEFIEAAKKIDEAQEKIYKIYQTIKGWMEELESLVDLVDTVLSPIVELASAVLEPLWTVIGWITDWQVEVARDLLGIGVLFIAGLSKMVLVFGKSIGESIGWTVKKFDDIGPAFKKMRDGAQELANNIKQSVEEIAENSFNWLVESLKGISDKIGEIVDGIADKFRNLWNKITGGSSSPGKPNITTSNGGGGGAGTISDDGGNDSGGFKGTGGGGYSTVNWYPGVTLGYASGTDYIPRDGLARVHQGERIVSNTSTSFGDISLNISGGSGVPSHAEWRRIVRAYVMPELAVMAVR
ncbi:MAG: phage tail tape measure protein [Magnetococcales bacterium]|nr:phage tail tape measure protein [Magnetococcales bacterium]